MRPIVRGVRNAPVSVFTCARKTGHLAGFSHLARRITRRILWAPTENMRLALLPHTPVIYSPRKWADFLYDQKSRMHDLHADLSRAFRKVGTFSAALIFSHVRKDQQHHLSQRWERLPFRRSGKIIRPPPSRPAWRRCSAGYPRSAATSCCHQVERPTVVPRRAWGARDCAPFLACRSSARICPPNR